MARQRVVIETVTCDICGKEVEDASTQAIGLGKDRWELDVCDADLQKLTKQFGNWTSKARRVQSSRRRTGRQAQDEWEYLESLGFTRHRGRKTAEEAAAIAARK